VRQTERVSTVDATTSGASAVASTAWTPEALQRGAVASVDLDALRSNLARVRELSGDVDVMAVVKADAYGHGLVPCARAALEGGATWLGAALPTEALALRAAGVGGRVLTWLETPGAPWAACLDSEIDVSVSAPWALAEVCAAAGSTGVRARVHLKADTGLSRNGASPDDWPALVEAARAAELEGLVEVTGIWSHFACADVPAHPSVARQLAVYETALEIATSAGLRPVVRHLANSAGALGVPASRYDLVRIGIAMYGLSPGADIGASGELGLRPVMTLRARLASVKRIPAGSGISYGHTYIAERDTNVGLVPLGYADGIPRSAANLGPVLAAGSVRPIAGRVCMDQVVLDLGDDVAEVGDEVVVFGEGGPSADDWAAACGTIGYEIVTRIGPRVPRVPLGVAP